MKRFSIKVNGVAYDVEVEENGSVTAPSASVPAAAPKAAVPAAAPAAAPAAPAPVAAGSAGSEAVKAPMPGTIISVNVAVGDSIKKGQVLVVLEAMKMENEICAPNDATVTSVMVSQGEAVDSGKAMVTLK